MGFSIGGFILTILSLIATFFVVGKVLGETCDPSTDCQSMLYVTTTFLASKRIETRLGFPVATERDLSNSLQTPFNDPASASRDRAYRFGHFLECMHISRMADRTCAPTLAFNDYAACIQNNTLIPSALDACAAFPSSGSVYSHWPTAEEYISCVWNNPLLQNSESRRASQNVFRYCVGQSLWPFFEIPQNMDSTIIFGSFHWGLFLLAAMIVQTSFMVYTCSVYEHGVVKRGEAQYYMRLAWPFSWTAFIWNLAFLIIFVVIAFRNAGEFQGNGGLPTTFSTSMVTLLVLGAAVMYFLSIIIVPTQRKFVAVAKSHWSKTATIEAVPIDTVINDNEHQRLLKATFPTLDPSHAGGKEAVARYELTDEDVAKFYTPPMLAIWSDSYLADFCFVLGFAGATGQLSTDVAWLLFSFTFGYRLLNMIISRCISDAFTNNVKLGDILNEYKNAMVSRPGKYLQPKPEFEQIGPKPLHAVHLEDAHISIRVIGLATQLGAIFLYIGIAILVFNENSAFADFNIFKNYIIFAFMIPEALRILVHVFYQVAYDYSTMGSVPWMLYNSFYFMWLWDTFLRILFVFIVFFETNNSPGTFDFLKTQTNTLMRDYVRYMAV